MSSNGLNKKYKKPKQKTSSTTNPRASRLKKNREGEDERSQPACPLLAKDSEWVDLLPSNPTSDVASSSSSIGEEEILQLVDCEDDPQSRPLAIMFPGLVDSDPQTLHGMLNKAMSTTEVTRRLVDLGQKANFTFTKKSSRLIPEDKEWLESVPEVSNSNELLHSNMYGSNFTSDYDSDNETSEGIERGNHKKRKKNYDLLMINDDDLDSNNGTSITERTINEDDLDSDNETSTTERTRRTEEDTADTARNKGGNSKRT